MNHRLWFIVHEWWNAQSEAIYYGIPALSICGSYIAYKFLLLPRDRTFLTKVHTIFHGTVQSKRSERTPEFDLGLDIRLNNVKLNFLSGKIPPKQFGMVWSIWFNFNLSTSVHIFTVVGNICLGAFKGITLESNQDFYSTTKPILKLSESDNNQMDSRWTYLK